ncbi:MAG: LCP family protein [Patescibacteria group bacterium]
MKEEPTVDFLKEKYRMAPDRQSVKKTKTALRIGGLFIVALAIAGVAFSYQIASTSVEDTSSSGAMSIISTFRRLITSDEKALVGEEDDRINFLLLGVGGAGHDGPELSDTIIFASFQPSTNEIGMLSIPRDLIVPIPGYGYRKINHINAYGEMENPGDGPQWASEQIGELLDQEIHYTVKVDFDGFEELIDAVGDIDVYVERTFSDYSYPAANDLYQVVSFSEGWTEMDGDTALKYSRSRHGTNGEGSDFARAKRQQKVLMAVKDKVLSPSVIFNPGKLNKIISTFQENVHTNLTFWEIMKLSRYAPDIQTENISHYVLDSSASSPLYSSNINGAYVLLPKKDDWSEVRNIAENIFDQNSFETFAETEETETVKSVQIEIQNGTGVSGLAFRTSQLLEGSGFEVIKIGNAESRSYDKTIIYDLSEGAKDDELAILKDFLEADVAMTAAGWIYADEVVPRELSVTTPGEDQATATGEIDFLVILGENTADFVMR